MRGCQRKNRDIGAEDDGDAVRMQKERMPIVDRMSARIMREVSVIRELWKTGTLYLTILKPANIPG